MKDERDALRRARLLLKLEAGIVDSEFDELGLANLTELRAEVRNALAPDKYRRPDPPFVPANVRDNPEWTHR